MNLNRKLLLACTLVLGAVTTALGADCTVKLGSILPVSGPMGLVGKRIADTGQLAVEVFNEAGGVNGCDIEFLLRDTQGDPKIGVDAAKNLVDVEGVPALIGAVSSGVSLPILSSVSAPSKITQVSCCSSSPSFTKLAKEGKTDGYWFRTYATSRTQAAMGALVTQEKGFQKTAVIYVNTDFGVNIAKQYQTDLEKLGGNTVAMIPYNEKQQSYRAEVTQALASEPDSLFLVAFPVDGATLTREWIALGGTGNLIVNNSLRSKDYLEAVGYKYLKDAIGYDSAQPRTESVATFNSLFEKKFDGPPDGPGLHSVYDAVTVVLLAMEASGAADGTQIRDYIRQVTDPSGVEVYPGAEGLKQAKQLLAEGKTIRYVGATGPLQFDQWGDVSSPKMTWRYTAEGTEEIKYYSLDEVTDLIQTLDK